MYLKFIKYIKIILFLVYDKERKRIKTPSDHEIKQYEDFEDEI
jgi:hypothetical protein